jgi:uncharacterized protein DUF5995
VAEAPVSEIDRLIARMVALLEPLEREADPRRFFLATYLRTTEAVKAELAGGGFVDGEWTERWDIAFADLYLEALEHWNRGDRPPAPWVVAFTAAEGERLPPLRHVLLGMNAHVNYDLPQSLLAVISDQQFDDPAVVARRGADHRHIDDILVERVAQEDRELAKVEQPGDRTLLDRLLTPFNRAGTKRFLKEARRKVWSNAKALSRARRQGPAALAGKLEELEALSAARVQDLKAPGQVLLKLAVRGFGVLLPP